MFSTVITCRQRKFAKNSFLDRHAAIFFIMVDCLGTRLCIRVRFPHHNVFFVIFLYFFLIFSRLLRLGLGVRFGLGKYKKNQHFTENKFLFFICSNGILSWAKYAQLHTKKVIKTSIHFFI